MTPKNKFPVFCYLCGTSLFFITFGIILLSTSSYIYQYIMGTSRVLAPNSISFDLWHKNPIPLSIDFYFFNWTNSEDVNDKSIKPKFQEIGPYRYIETKEKENITWNLNGTVSYTMNRKWYFDEKNSNGSKYDLVTSLNAVAISAAYAARNWNYFVKKGLSMTLQAMSPKVHITRPVGQLLFEGYEDSLMSVAGKMPFLAGASLPPMDKFGWFYSRNGSSSYEGNFNMDTGVHGKLGELYKWKNEDRVPYFEGTCGKVEGSAGEMFPTNLNKESIIKFFSSDICRKVELEYETEAKISNIQGYRYSAQDRFLDNGTKVPENKCFCVGDCMPSGAVNVSACRYGTPSFVSLPHFYNADPHYLNDIEGMKPDKKKHDFYMIFEPATGVPLEVAARLQLNLMLQPISNIGLYEKVPTVYFPMLWFEQVVKIPDNMTFYLKLLVNIQTICVGLGILLICIGLSINFCFVYKLCSVNMCAQKKSELIIREMVPLKAPL